MLFLRQSKQERGAARSAVENMAWQTATKEQEKEIRRLQSELTAYNEVCARLQAELISAWEVGTCPEGVPTHAQTHVFSGEGAAREGGASSDARTERARAGK